jgi:hypothetical protein
MTQLKRQKFPKIRLIHVLLSGLVILILLSCFGCAVQRADSAGRVNGVYIKKQDFMNSLRGHFTGFMLEKDRTPTENERRELFNKTWKDIAIHVVLKEYFRKYGIQVAQQEIIDTLLNNIPANMMKAPLFQTNGAFDKSLYVQELMSETSQKLDWLKRYYYDYYIPIAKLKLKLQSDSVIGNSELNKLDKVLNSTADIEWIAFDPQQTGVEVSQSEIENYYHGHMEEYSTKPYASFGWAAVPISLNEYDINLAQAKIDSIYYEITNGGSFAAMAEQFSQSGTAKSGGSMGFIKIEELPSAVSKALEGLDKNSYTRPVKLSNSWVIYQLVERTKNLVKLNELVIKIAPGADTKTAAQEDAIQLRDLALQLGLETAAQEMDYKYKLSGIVAKDSLWLRDGDISAYLIDRAYTQKAGAILEPVYSEVMRAWIVAYIIDVQPYQYKPLISVSDEISSRLKANKQKTKALDDVESWAQLNKANLLAAAQNQSLPILKTPALLVTGTVMAMPVRSNFVKIITDFQQKKPQKPYQIGDKILLPVVSNLRNVVPPLFSQNEARKYYFEYLNPDWFDKWLDAEIKKTDIKVWGTYP